MKRSSTYSIEGNYREQMSKWIAVISVILFFAVDEYFVPQVMAAASCFIGTSQSLNAIAEILISVLSAFLFYSILWWWFDSYLWKCKVFTRWHHLKDLNGTWIGKGISSFKDDRGNNIEYPFTLFIKQTFTQMACQVQTANSFSNATLIGLRCVNDLETLCFLEMAYSNKTTSEKSAKNDLWPDSHEGFCRYSILENELNGKYFTNSKPQTKGQIILRRTKDCDDAHTSWRPE